MLGPTSTKTVNHVSGIKLGKGSLVALREPCWIVPLARALMPPGAASAFMPFGSERTKMCS